MYKLAHSITRKEAGLKEVWDDHANKRPWYHSIANSLSPNKTRSFEKTKAVKPDSLFERKDPKELEAARKLRMEQKRNLRSILTN